MNTVVNAQLNMEESFAKLNRQCWASKCIRKHLHANIMTANMGYVFNHQELMATYANAPQGTQVCFFIEPIDKVSQRIEGLLLPT